jgi:hypothetical protein
MADLMYHRLNPDNFKDRYFGNDIVDFTMSFPNRKLKMGSVKLNYKLGMINNGGRPEAAKITPAPTPANPNPPPVPNPTAFNRWTRFNALTGAHSMISSVSVSAVNLGTVQNLSDYHRYVSTMRNATHTESDMNNASLTTELACARNQITNNLLYGEISRDIEDPTQRVNMDASVSLKPKFVLNQPIGDPLLPYVKTGDLKLSFQLNPEQAFLYGSPSIGGLITYYIYDVHLTFQSFDDDGVYSKSYMMRTTGNLRTQIQSNETAVYTKYSMLADSVIMSFIETSHLSDPQHKYDPLACETLPSVHRVIFQWNNANEQITYELDNNTELLENFVKALRLTQEHNHNNLSNMYSGSGYGLGLNFNSLVNLASNKFGVIIRSDVSSADPFTAYMFFNGMITVQ